MKKITTFEVSGNINDVFQRLCTSTTELNLRNYTRTKEYLVGTAANPQVGNKYIGHCTYKNKKWIEEGEIVECIPPTLITYKIKTHSIQLVYTGKLIPSKNRIQIQVTEDYDFSQASSKIKKIVYCNQFLLATRIHDYYRMLAIEIAPQLTRVKIKYQCHLNGMSYLQIRLVMASLSLGIGIGLVSLASLIREIW